MYFIFVCCRIIYVYIYIWWPNARHGGSQEVEYRQDKQGGKFTEFACLHQKYVYVMTMPMAVFVCVCVFVFTPEYGVFRNKQRGYDAQRCISHVVIHQHDLVFE